MKNTLNPLKKKPMKFEFFGIRGISLGEKIIFEGHSKAA